MEKICKSRKYKAYRRQKSWKKF